MKSLNGRGYCFVFAVYDCCRLSSDFNNLKALLPDSDASKLTAVQEDAENAQKAADAKDAKLKAELEEVKENLAEHEIILAELQEAIFIEDLKWRGGVNFVVMKEASNYYSIHGANPNRAVAADSHLAADILQHLIVMS